MKPSRTEQIRTAIRECRSDPRQLSRWRKEIARALPRLHGSIHLPVREPEAALMDFLLRYVEHAPNFIDAMAGLSQEAGIGQYTDIFLCIAEDFFLDPPEVIGSCRGLDALVAEAYLVHRLLEEVNDRVVGRCGIPLMPMDMTRANLVTHQLLGETFANDLDFVVLYSTELHMDREALMDNPTFHRFVEQHRAFGWDAELRRWPCLAEDLSINLAFQATIEDERPTAIH